jgi:hypothetical protein
LLGASTDVVRSHLQNHNLGPSEEESLRFSDSPDLYRLIFSQNNIEFWFKHDKLDCILWGYLIDSDDQIRWPIPDGG